MRIPCLSHETTRNSTSGELERRRIRQCSFVNVPQRTMGARVDCRKNAECIGLNLSWSRFRIPEWAEADHVRHIKFFAMRSDDETHKVLLSR